MFCFINDVCMVEGPKINNNHEKFCITLAKIHFTDTICYITHKSSRAFLSITGSRRC